MANDGELAATRDGDAALVPGRRPVADGRTASGGGGGRLRGRRTASSGDTTRWHTNLTGDDVYYPDRAEEDARLLTYTGAPLDAVVRITGTPVVSLHLASTEADGALHVYLEDVAPDGRVTYMTEGILRLIHGVSDDTDLPYEHPGPPRTFRRAEAVPLTPGEVVRVEMPLYATSVRLEAGHRLRIAIAGHDASTFARYPEEGEPVLTVVHSPASPSFLELPVPPTDRRAWTSRPPRPALATMTHIHTVRAPFRSVLTLNPFTGILLIVVFGIVRVALVLQTNVTGSYWLSVSCRGDDRPAVGTAYTGGAKAHRTGAAGTLALRVCRP